MNNEEIIIISLTLSTILMVIIYIIKKILFKISLSKKMKRAIHIKKLIDNKTLLPVSINIEKESNRLKDTYNHIGIIIDDVIYTDKNSFFIEYNKNIYIIGKKEDFCIELIRENI